jgi:CRP-like cAMP-binding protein
MRQRLLRQSFRRLIANTEVEHDYESDARIILSRKLLDDEIRTELEIEVLFNWIDSIKNVDPTSIANTILMCKKRTFIFNALQQLRLEFYGAGETVLFQGDMPRPEDGHFTIVDGSCEVVQFPEDSTPLQKTLYMSKQRQWDDCKKLLLGGVVVANIHKFSGFGELSTLTGVKRAATIRADRTPGVVTEIAVLPKQALLDCLKFRRVGEVVEGQLEGLAPSEAMDFMRQSGLANRISPKDLVRAAHCMIRHTLMQGDVLFYKGQYVNSIFLVVSGGNLFHMIYSCINLSSHSHHHRIIISSIIFAAASSLEFLLDTRDCFVEGSRDPQPFLDSYPEVCYYLSGGSVLGDEGVTGRDRLFLSKNHGWMDGWKGIYVRHVIHQYNNMFDT